MMLIDKLLQARKRNQDPVRVGLIGAGFMGAAIADQVINATPGMHLAAVSNRNRDKAREAYTLAGAPEPAVVGTLDAMNDAIRKQRGAITDDPYLVCAAEGLDAIIEVTGQVEFGAQVTLWAIQNRKHVVLMNAELDGTLGPILKTYADRAGVIYTNSDGDQPGVQMNLFRFVRGLGLIPLVCGNNKGLQDRYRNPTTQEGFARKWGQKAPMVTSFADGTKISFEQAVVANGTGMTIARRGMNGFHVTGTFDDLVTLYDIDELRELGGIVDYVVGSRPSPGIFVFAAARNPRQRPYLRRYQLGEGPLYSFYTPYHLCHFEVPASVARAVLYRDPVLTPLGAPRVDVVATAKINLKAGHVLDGIGHYMTYGQCERSDVVRLERLLPMGLAEGCILQRDIERDEVLRNDDVILPKGRLSDRLRAEQDALFFAPLEPTYTSHAPLPLSR